MRAPFPIVFTDLDGTLLDHDTYSYALAEPALTALRDRHIPLILASSKTAAEIEPLRAALGFEHCPAIVENGAGQLAAQADATDGQDTYERLLAILNAAPANLRRCFAGFHEWDAHEIARRTNLPLAQARRAAKRAYSEPGLLSGDGADALLNWLVARGVTARRGGRFVTLSFGGRKSDQMSNIIVQYGQDAMRPVSLALGDAPNDIEMLEAADHGVIIANAAHAPIPPLAGEADGRIIRTAACGPKAWNDAVLAWLNAIQTSH